MAIEENNGLSELNPIDKDLKIQEEIKRRQSRPISTIQAPTNKTYVDDVHIDIGAYQKEQKSSGAGYKLTPETFIEAKPILDEYNKKQEIKLNDYMARNQSTTEKVGNGIVKFGGRVYTSVAGSTIGSLYGLYAWSRDGEFKSFYDNEFQRSLDGVNDYLAQEYKHYYTSSQDDWEIGNFVFDKVFDGLGFATGAVLSSLIGGGVTGALTKSFKLTNSLKYKAIDKLLEANKTASTSGKIYNAQKTANQIANLDRLSKLPQQVSGLVTGAVYESGVEARHGYNETREILIDTYKQMHEGKSPIGKDLDEINEIASRTANGIFAANMVVVGGGNILQFGKHLGLDFSDYTKVFKPNVAKKVINEAGEEVFQKTGSKAYRITKNIVKNAVVESQEEMIQSVISGTGKDYALTKFNNDGKADLNNLLNSSIKAFKKTYGSSEGWEEGLIGAIVGSAGVVSPRSRTKEDGTKQIPVTLAGGIRESIKEYRNEEARRDQIVANLNEKGSTKSLEEGIKHHIRERRISQIQDTAVNTGDEMLYKNAEDDSFHSFVTSRLEAGMIESVYKDLSDLQSKSLEEFKSIFGIPEDADFTEEIKHKQIKSFEDRAKSIEQSTKFVDKVYRGSNPVVREALIYNQSMINRIDKRISNIRKYMQDLSGVVVNMTPDAEGKVMSKKEMFKDVSPKNLIHKSVYESLYDDHIKLENRSRLMLNELLSLLDTKGKSEAEQFIEEGLSEVEKQEELTKAKKEEAKKEEEKLKKAEELKKQKDIKNKDKEVISSMLKSLSEQKNVSEEPIQMSSKDIQTVINNINNLKTKEEFDKFIKDLKGNIKLLPLPIQEAIVKKIDEYGKELSKLTQEDVDPINASGNTTVDDTVKENINSTINTPTDLNVPPIDATSKENYEEDLSKSHEGKTKTGINNEEVRENGKEIYTVDGRLLDAHNTIANSTRLYREDDNGKFIRLNEINPNTNPDVLSSEKLLEGTQLKIELFQDEYLETFNSDGTSKDQKDWLKNTFNSPNQIMVVKDMNDTIVGYLHEQGYITPDRIFPLRGKEDNLEINRQLLSENRTKVFEHISKNGTPYQVTVLGKTSGRMFVQQSEKYNIPLSKAITDDTRPQILVVKEDGFWLGKNHIKDTYLKDKLYQDFDTKSVDPKTGESISFFKKYKGATVIAVPSANGSYLISFVKNSKLSENQNLRNMIQDVLIAYIKQDEEKLYKYDLDVSDLSIQNFLSNYLYTVSDFNSSYTFSLKTDPNTNKPRIIFKDINGNNIVLNENTLSNKSVVSSFEERLNNSVISVNLNAYTNNEYVKYKSDGILKDIKYRDMLQDNLYVNFLGNDITRTDGKSERVYTANPIIALDFNNSIQLTHEPHTKKKPLFEEEGNIDEESFLMFDEDNNVIPEKQKETKQPESIGKAVTTKGTLLGSMVKKNKKVTPEDKKALSLLNREVSQEEINKKKKDCQ